ncbi:glutathione ABC transporter substrate-binding protein [Oceanobacillus sp. FSL W8-0428]|uniref:Glutathione ABC transporter substrate-binding protein n=1 Tax=Oceanobacillus sojae TaxID=582851 RepID=A0A511ZN43_9BACI|nr:glutathione ABC transporter substrate-binding protein [Oceanobacillus sojae]GEN88868.1 glutathione ABC transporter substrate-binding protein [Oceanobacillus sojae]
MRIQKKIYVLVFIALLSLVLAACASEPDSNTNESGSNDSEGGTPGGDLTITTPADAVSLDPAASNDTPSSDVQRNIFETLVTQDENMEVQPLLAEEWEQIDDTTWEFKLRQDVKFHDGSDFNADVVKANIDRTLDPDVGSPRAIMYNMISEVEVVDDYTVHFKTEYPFAALPAHLAHPGGVMISKDQIEEDYAAMEDGEDAGNVISANPQGTGPFKYDEWQPGQYVRLVNNEDYWGEPALLDSVTFKVVTEDLTRIAELQTGDSQVANSLSPSDVAQIEGSDHLSVQAQDSLALSYLGFNMEKEPFDDVRVRQAIAKAIDKEEILSGIYDDVGIPAHTPIAPSVFGYSEDVKDQEYNIEEAKELLAEAGLEDGFSTTIWTNDDRQRIDTATNIQAQLKEIGINAEVRTVEWGSMLEQTANGEHDMFVFGWTTVTGDADNGLYPLFHSDNLGESGNRTFTVDPELDDLLDQARQEGDPDERLELYRQTQELLAEITPMVYIHHQQYLLGVDDSVKGLTQSPTQLLNLKEVSIEQ